MSDKLTKRLESIASRQREYATSLRLICRDLEEITGENLHALDRQIKKAEAVADGISGCADDMLDVVTRVHGSGTGGPNDK